VDPVTTDSSTAFGVAAQQSTLNTSSLSGRVPPDAWKQTQAYYNYMQHQKNRNPNKSTLLIALDEHQKENKSLAAVDDMVSERQQWQQQQMQEQQYQLEEQWYELEERLQQEKETKPIESDTVNDEYDI